MLEEFGPESGWTEEDEPESVQLIDDDHVIREKETPAGETGRPG